MCMEPRWKWLCCIPSATFFQFNLSRLLGNPGRETQCSNSHPSANIHFKNSASVIARINPFPCSPFILSIHIKARITPNYIIALRRMKQDIETHVNHKLVLQPPTPVSQLFEQHQSNFGFLGCALASGRKEQACM